MWTSHRRRHSSNEMTQCRVCKRVLPASRFYHRNDTSKGRRSECKVCLKTRVQRQKATPHGRMRNRERSRRARQQGRWRANERRRAPWKRVPDVTAKARRAVRRALERGELRRPSHCERCCESARPRCDGRSGLHAHHHRGYGHPLDVQWLCTICHNEMHRALPPRRGT